MRKLYAPLLLTLMLGTSAYAQSVDDILIQPPMTLEAGTTSAPIAETSLATPPHIAVKAETPPHSATTEKTQTPVAAPPPAATRKMAMKDILAKAYTDSPFLRAEREVLRQQYENVAQADSYKRPVVTADGGAAWTNAKTDPGTRDSYVARDAGVTLTQFLYRGGRTLADVEQQLSLSAAAMAAYDTATQTTFLNVIGAAMDIQSTRIRIDLTEKNRAVIEGEMQRARRAFDVGELTRTDVAQATARLAGADADLMAARADLANALARFRQYAGQDGTDLDVIDAQPQLPPTLDVAQSQGLAQHPEIITARESATAAERAVDLASGELRPEIYVAGTAGKSWDPSPILDSSQSAALGVRASMPLYEGGAIRSAVRQAKYSQFEKQDRVEDAERDVARLVSSAWSDYQAANTRISARQKQVDAAQLARNGVYKEQEVGTRTVLDTLNADAELLDAQVGLVQAQRDETVAAYALLAATGGLTGQKLGFFDVQAEKKRLDSARGNWFGTAASPRD